MSSTVHVGGWEIQSNTESAEEMVQALKPAKDSGKTIKPIKDRGQEVKGKEDKPAITVSEAGKKGGEAAAKAREAKAKEEAKQETKPDEKEPEKAAPAKDAEDTETRKGSDAKEPDDASDADVSKDAKIVEKEDPRVSAQARIRELARERAEARREAEEARREAAQARQEVEEARRGREAPARPATPSYQADPNDPEPDPNQYDDYIKLAKDSAAWAARQENRRLETQRQQRAWVEARAKYLMEQSTGFVERFQSAGDGYTPVVDPDTGEQKGGKIAMAFMDLVPSWDPGSSKQPPVATMFADGFFRCEHPAQVMAYLTDHPEESRRIAATGDPYTIAHEFAKIDVRYETGSAVSAEHERKASSAPPPITPIAASAQHGEPDLTGEMDFDAFMKKSKGRKR